MQSKDKTDNSILDTALDLGSQGYRLIPLYGITDDGDCSCSRGASCHSPGKHPATKNGVKDASSDPEIIRQWFEHEDARNIGKATGGGLMVIDVDGRNGGERESIGELPQTLSVRTSARSYHLYFRYSPDITIPNSTSKLAPGIDVRGERGYAVAEASKHVSGDVYQVIDDSEIAHAPQWLLDKIGAKLPAQSRLTIPITNSFRLSEVVRKGKRDDSIFRIACAMRRNNLSEGAILAAIRIENEAKCLPPLKDEQLTKIARQAAKYNPEVNDQESNEDHPVADDRERLAVINMADVEAEDIEWLWYPFIALRKLTILEGPPGVGKSTLLCSVTASVTTGTGLPGNGKSDPQTVLILSAEDGLADTVRRRLDAAKADVSRVVAVTQPLTLDPAGLNLLERAIAEYGPALVTIDPLFGYTGGKVDIHKANACRAITMPLADIAEKHNCAIVAVRHLSKSKGQGDALNAGIGSIDIAASARSVLLVGANPDDPEDRAMVQTKNNLAAYGPAVGYSIEDGKFKWKPFSTLTAAAILAPSYDSEKKRDARADAVEFLRDYLDVGPASVEDIQTAADAANVSWATLRRATVTLRVRKTKTGQPGSKDQKWMWELPEDAQGTGAHDAELDHLRTNHNAKGVKPQRLAEGAQVSNGEHLREQQIAADRSSASIPSATSDGQGSGCAVTGSITELDGPFEEF